MICLPLLLFLFRRHYLPLSFHKPTLRILLLAKPTTTSVEWVVVVFTARGVRADGCWDTDESMAVHRYQQGLLCTSTGFIASHLPNRVTSSLPSARSSPRRILPGSSFRQG